MRKIKKKNLIIIGTIIIAVVLGIFIYYINIKDNKIDDNSFVFLSLDGEDEEWKLTDAYVVLHGEYAYYYAGQLEYRGENTYKNGAAKVEISLIAEINNKTEKLTVWEVIDQSSGTQIFNQKTDLTSIYGKSDKFIEQLYDETTERAFKLQIYYIVDGKIHNNTINLNVNEVAHIS